MNKKPYYDFATFLRSRFGCRVQKITIDAGFTCPNRDGTISYGGCIFCNAKGSGTGAASHGLSITEQLERGKQSLSKRYKAKKFLAYFQAHTNTYASIDRLKSLYRQALAVDGVVGLSIGTRPDCVDKNILNLLEDLAKDKMIWLEYGLQSSNDNTLKFINRGHDSACFAKAVMAAHDRGILTCAHVILGLPGESRKHMLDTAKFLAALPVDGVKIHLLYVVKGTKMETLYRQKKYTCLDQVQYVEIVCDFLELLPPDMVIQRLTSDPHKHELVAPQWSLEKGKTLVMINQLMLERDSVQGKFYDSSSS